MPSVFSFSIIFFKSTFSTSLFINSKLLYNENLSSSICNIFVSSSIHITFPAFSSKYFVSVPSPGPISITRSSFSMLLHPTMFFTTSSFIKKFCPRFLFALMLYFFIINLVSSNIFSIWCPFFFYFCDSCLLFESRIKTYLVGYYTNNFVYIQDFIDILHNNFIDCKL